MSNKREITMAVAGYGKTTQVFVRGLGEPRLVVFNSSDGPPPPEVDPCPACEHRDRCPKLADGTPNPDETRFFPVCQDAASWRKCLKMAVERE